jgi:hypothetical protein
MVLLNAGKAARNAGKTVNRTNTCGGPMKAGIGKGVGTSRSAVVMSVMRRAPNSLAKNCNEKKQTTHMYSNSGSVSGTQSSPTYGGGFPVNTA